MSRRWSSFGRAGDEGQTPEESIRLLAEAFPDADVAYLRGLFAQRTEALELETERHRLSASRSKAVDAFLQANSYANIEEAADHLGLSPQQVWDKIMSEANLPPGEMPETIQVG